MHRGKGLVFVCYEIHVNEKAHEMENDVRADLSEFGLQSFGIGFGSSSISVKGTGRSL